MGNPTDMYGGTVISCAIDRRARVTISPATELVLDTAGTKFTISGPDDYTLRGDLFDVPRAVLGYFLGDDLHCRIQYSSSVPMSAGLSSSTALTVAMVYGVLVYLNQLGNLYQVAELARYVELNHMRVICGYQDAYMCTFGQLNYLDFRGKEYYREYSSELYATVERLDPMVPQLPFVLAHTGKQHSSDAVHRPLRELWLDGDTQVRQGYERIALLAREGKRALLAENWTRFGALMNENHDIQRGLGGSGEANERVIRKALEFGALGAKLSGAGDGGTIIALSQDPDRLSDQLLESGCELVMRPCPVRGVGIDSVQD